MLRPNNSREDPLVKVKPGSETPLGEAGGHDERVLRVGDAIRQARQPVPVPDGRADSRCRRRAQRCRPRRLES